MPWKIKICNQNSWKTKLRKFLKKQQQQQQRQKTEKTEDFKRK